MRRNVHVPALIPIGVLVGCGSALAPTASPAPAFTVGGDDLHDCYPATVAGQSAFLREVRAAVAALFDSRGRALPSTEALTRGG